MAKGISSGTIPTNNATIDGSETLSNKTLDSSNTFSGSVESPTRLDPKKDTLSSLQTYAATAQNGELVYATDTKEFYVVTDGALTATGGGVGGVDILEVITSFDSSSGLTTLTSGVNGDTFRLTHAAGSTEFAQRDISLDDKWRNKILELVLDMKTTAASGNFKVIVTDETNTKTLADEVITPQDADAKTSKRRFTFSTTPADGDSDISTIKVRFEALAEAGSPTSDFDDIVVQLATTEVREIVAIEQEENVFSARIDNNGTASIVSQSSPFIASVERVSVGIVTVNFKSGFFSVAPSVAGVCLDTNRTLSAITAPSVSSVTLRAELHDGVISDQDFSIIVQRQGSDYRNLERRVEREKSTFHEILAANEEQITEWTDFTPTGGWTGAVSYVGKWRRVGENMEVNATVTTTGTPTGSDLSIDLPSGYFIDTSKLPSASTSVSYLGTGTVHDNGTSTEALFVRYFTTSAVRLVHERSLSQVITPTSPFTFVNGDTIEVFFSIPISGWEVKPLYTVFEAAPDSKVEIPTSELRMEGSTSLGTGSEANTIEFDSVSKLRGDAITVDNTNGSVFTVQKDGLLSVEVSYFNNSVAQNLFITKNQSDNTTLPTRAETMGSSGTIVSGRSGASATFFVKAGDVIRASCAVAPTSDAIGNFISLNFQETKVQVAVSNVTPQYEDADSMVRLKGVPVKIGNTIVLPSLLDNIGTDISYSNGESTVLSDGFYSINATIRFVSIDGRVLITKNSLTTDLTDDNTLNWGQTHEAGGYNALVSWSGFLNKGDVIRLTSLQGVDTVGSSKFTIAKVGVPSIAEVDVTPFADVNRLERGNATLNGYAGYPSSKFNPYFSNVADQNLNGLGTLTNDSTNGCKFTALEDCHVVVSFNIATDGGGNDYCGISRNGDNGTIFSTWSTSNKADTLAYSYSGSIGDRGMSWSGYLKAGDFIMPHTNGEAPNPIDSASFSISVEKDSRTTMYSIAQTENEFSARIANNGTASIVSESQNFIDSVIRESQGVVRVNFVSGFFTETPAIQATVSAELGTTYAGTRAADYFDLDTTGVRIATKFSDAAGNNVLDYDFELHVSRQGADRKDLQRAIVQLDAFPKINRTIVGSIAVQKAPATVISISGTYGYLPISDSDVSLGEGIFTKTSAGDGVLFLKDAVVNAGFDLIDDNNQHAKIIHLQDEEGGAVVAEYGTVTQEQNNVWRSSSANLKVRAGQVIRFGKTNANIDATIASSRIHMVAQAQELERVTNVDAAENVFSARIDTTSGTATIVSQSSSFISGFSKTGTGDYTINFVPDFFTVAPSIVVSPERSGGAVASISFVGAITKDSCRVRMSENSTPTTLADMIFDIHVSRQGNDYKSIQDVVATVFTPKVAIIQERQSSNTSSSTSFSAGSYVTNTLNTVKGDSEIVSLSASQFTLQPGKYSIESVVPIYKNNSTFVNYSAKARLYSITDSNDIEVSTAWGSRNGGNTGGHVDATSFNVTAIIEITEPKTYEVQTRVSDTTSAISCGVPVNFGDDEVYTTVKITKIN